MVGTAANGRLAQAKIDQLEPDVVTMDIEMPEMDGIDAVRELRKRHPRLPVIMFSTLSAAGATATLDALAAGATDYVTKPTNVGSVAESIAGRPRPAGPPDPRAGRPPAGRPRPHRPASGRPAAGGHPAARRARLGAGPAGPARRGQAAAPAGSTCSRSAAPPAARTR